MKIGLHDFFLLRMSPPLIIRKIHEETFGRLPIFIQGMVDISNQAIKSIDLARIKA
jgi:hypothetical protein